MRIRHNFFVIISGLIILAGLGLVLNGCGGGGSAGGGGSISIGTINLQVGYPQDKGERVSSGEKDDYPDPDYIAFYLIDILDPVTMSNVVETYRIDYPQTEANIGEVPVGEVIVRVSGYDQYNYIRTLGSSRATVVADQNSVVGINMSPISPSPMASPSITPTYSPTPTPTVTASPTPTVTPSSSPSPSPTPTASVSPTPTPTYTPTPTPTPSPTPTSAGRGVLYACSQNANLITAYNGVSRGQENLTPNRWISSSLDEPRGIVMDTGLNLLYICDKDSTTGKYRVCVIANASTATGLIAVSRSFLTPGGFENAWGLFLDQPNDRLYIAGHTSDGYPRIYVYDQASLASGEALPSRTIDLDSVSTLDSYHIFVDLTNNIGYISDGGNEVVYVLDGISTLDGSQTPNRTISISTGELEGAKGLAVYNNTLYVTNYPAAGNGGITVINNASTANGSIAPSRYIGGVSTTLASPVAICIDGPRNMMYIGNRAANRITAFKNFQTINGNTAPEYYIEGAATMLNVPLGLFVDVTRDN